MSMKEIGGKIVLGLNKAKFSIVKNSPEILVVAGAIGVVAGAVLACKATLKVDEVLAETREDLEKIHSTANDEEKKERYSEEDKRRDLGIVYGKAFVKLLKLYGPALAVEIVSLVAILGGHDILRKRNAALAAAYTTLDKGYKEYRKRVKEVFGEDAERRIKHNLKVEEIEETSTDEKGETKTETKKVEVAENNGVSEYACFFDELCGDWKKDAEYNLMFLRKQQEYCNQLLRARGHLFLNEVYDAIGVPRRKCGQVIGWLYDPNNSSLQNYVDFGLYNIYHKGSVDFVNGYERSILLDFNPDGYILNKI